MVVMMPVMMPDMVDGVWDGSTWKDTYNTDVHLYPKNEIREADKQMNVEESDLRQVTIINEAGEQETISYIDLERGKTASTRSQHLFLISSILSLKTEALLSKITKSQIRLQLV